MLPLLLLGLLIILGIVGMLVFKSTIAVGLTVIGLLLGLGLLLMLTVWLAGYTARRGGRR